MLALAQMKLGGKAQYLFDHDAEFRAIEDFGEFFTALRTRFEGSASEITRSFLVNQLSSCRMDQEDTLLEFDCRFRGLMASLENSCLLNKVPGETKAQKTERESKNSIRKAVIQDLGKSFYIENLVPVIRTELKRLKESDLPDSIQDYYATASRFEFLHQPARPSNPEKNSQDILAPMGSSRRVEDLPRRGTNQVRFNLEAEPEENGKTDIQAITNQLSQISQELAKCSFCKGHRHRSMSMCPELAFMQNSSSSFNPASPRGRQDGRPNYRFGPTSRSDPVRERSHEAFQQRDNFPPRFRPTTNWTRSLGPGRGGNQNRGSAVNSDRFFSQPRFQRDYRGPRQANWSNNTQPGRRPNFGSFQAMNQNFGNTTGNYTRENRSGSVPFNGTNFRARLDSRWTRPRSSQQKNEFTGW